MLLNEKMCETICDLENIIGSECYNPNSYDGWREVEGCDFRYPITVPVGNGVLYKAKSNIKNAKIYDEEQREFLPLIERDGFGIDSLKYMKYKFGSNELFIGLGLIGALDYLEKRYGLDFNKLEDDRETEV